MSFCGGSGFSIRCQLGGMVLDLENGSLNPGTRIVTAMANNSASQTWYEESGMIKNRANNFCIDVSGNNSLVVNYPQPGNPNQMWEKSGSNIRNRQRQQLVFDIEGANPNPGAKILAYNANYQPNQNFEFVPASGGSGGSSGQGMYGGGSGGYQSNYGYQPSSQPTPYQPSVYPSQPGQTMCQPGYNNQPTGNMSKFYITSEKNGKVLDIQRADRNEGAGVIIYPKKCPPAQNQLWYFEGNGVIKSHLNGLALDGSCGKVRMAHCNNSPSQTWSVRGNSVVNGTGECLDIQGASDADGAAVIPYKYKGSANQHWRIDYV